MLPNAYFLAKFRFDTAENEPAKNLQNFEKCIFEKCIFEKCIFRKFKRRHAGGRAARGHRACPEAAGQDAGRVRSPPFGSHCWQHLRWTSNTEPSPPQQSSNSVKFTSIVSNPILKSNCVSVCQHVMKTCPLQNAIFIGILQKPGSDRRLSRG